MSTTSTTPPRPIDATGSDLRPLIALHVAFLAAGGVVLSLGEPAKGWGVLACVAVYIGLLPTAARRSGNDDLVALAWFLIPVSVFQVLPDWILSDLLGILHFPHTGGLRVDDVIPVAMAGMWVAPLFAAVALAGGRAGRAALLALVIFLGSELIAPYVGLWEPAGDTHRLLGIAIYVLPAEAALGWAAATAFTLTRHSGAARRVAAALAVSTFYLGALVLAHFLVDVAGWRITA